MKRKIVKTFKNLLLLSVSIVICIIFLEVVLRMLYPYEYALEREHILTDIGIFGRVPYFELKHITPEFSITYNHNSKGLRDYEYSYEKNPSTYRIIMVGDSVTEGIGVEFEESIPKVLDKKLKQIGDYEVINFGFAGFGPVPEAIIIEEEVMKYNPDMIIIGYYIGNDVTKIDAGVFNRIPDEFWLEEQHEMLKKELYKAKVNTKFRNFLRRNFMIYRFIKEKFIYKFTHSKLNIDDFKDLVVLREQYPDYINKNLNTTYLVFDFLKRLTEENDIDFLVTLLPIKEQIYPDLFNVEGDLKKPQRLLKNQLEQLNISFLDPSSVLEERDEIVYWKIDDHPNKRGYEIIADYIYTELKDNWLKNEK